MRSSQTKENPTPVKASAQNSAMKKNVKKAATEPLVEEKKEEPVEKKKKIEYKEDEESASDGASDSEPSEDNLEDDAIMKLIPKKLGKKKYIKGIEEKKKKVVPPPEKKVPPKKPKTELMPCMSQKKERDAKTNRDASMSATKKVLPVERKPPPLITTKMRNGGRQRDVGTQIQYKGDGSNLSLMELDILRHTGCKWSRIIYVGFKGYIRP